jgi:hypothetical protein
MISFYISHEKLQAVLFISQKSRRPPILMQYNSLIVADCMIIHLHNVLIHDMEAVHAY